MWKNWKILQRKIIIYSMGKQSGLSNGPKGLSFAAVNLGNSGKVSWIKNVIAFENSTPTQKYEWYLQKYNIFPGHRIR
jgi:hypothetical protein